MCYLSLFSWNCNSTSCVSWPIIIIIYYNMLCYIADVCISCEMVLVPAAWLYGDPRHVLYPRNSTGMFCGVGQNNDKPSVMYFDIIKCATATNIMAAALQGLQCPTTQVPDLLEPLHLQLIILCVVEAILLLALIFLRTRILIAIALIQETSKALGHMMSTLFYPIVTFVLLLVCVSYWGITALYLATSGAPFYKVVAMNTSQSGCSVIRANETCDPEYPTCPSARCVFINYNTEGLFQRNLFNLQIYNVFAFLWCVNFVIALGHCTLAGAFGSYYWAFSKPADIPTFPLIQSFMRALRYHVGSLAFGALILTLVQIVRIVLEYLDHKFKEAQNPCTRFIMCCLKCCFYCLEKFIKFINRNAYIMIAIYGKNFCVSAKNAFSLLMRNIIRVVVLDKVTDLLLFFGKLLVVGGVGVLAFFFFSGRIQTPGTTFETAALNYYWMPIITVVFGAYLIAHGFFSVYNMGVDTLFLCFLEDLERNDGSPEKPYFMSKNLMKILNKKNKAPKTS
uniref:Choline transporter-like protein n=1 Tax=Cyprinus carpio TaxID=7962 RepID=A0A8C1V085_CYPCA